MGFDSRMIADLKAAAEAKGITVPVIAGRHVNDQAVRILEAWGGTVRSTRSHNERVRLAFADITGAAIVGSWNNDVLTKLQSISAGGTQLAVNDGTRAQQNTSDLVVTAAITISGGTAPYTHTWDLIDPDGDSRSSLYDGTLTDLDPGDWNPDGPGVWEERCTIDDADGNGPITYTRQVQVGDDDGFIHIDTSAGVEGTVSMKGSATALGVAGTYEVEATHGLPDGDLNCYTNATTLLARPADLNKTILRLYVPSAPPEDPGSSYAVIGVGMSPNDTIALNEGHHTGLTQTGTPTQRLGACKRWGTEGSATAPNLGAGPYTLELVTEFDGTQELGAIGRVAGADDSLSLADTNQATGTFTNPRGILFMGQKGAAPTSKVKWPAGTVFSYKHA